MDVVAEPRKVNWLAVIAGLVTAWVTGLFLGIMAVAAAAQIFGNRDLLIVANSTIAVFLVYFVVFWVGRQRFRDFAVGLLIGGCMMALAGGACGALLSGLQNMH